MRKHYLLSYAVAIAFGSTAGLAHAEILNYEWENGTLSGGATVEYGGGLYEGAAAGTMHYDGATARLDSVDGGQAGGTKTLVLYYGQMTSETITKVIKVNGTAILLTLPPTSAWIGDPQPMEFEAQMLPGTNNTFEVTTEFPHWGGVTLDRLSVNLGNDVATTGITSLASQPAARSGAIRTVAENRMVFIRETVSSGSLPSAQEKVGIKAYDLRGRGFVSILPK